MLIPKSYDWRFPCCVPCSLMCHKLFKGTIQKLGLWGFELFPETEMFYAKCMTFVVHDST